MTKALQILFILMLGLILAFWLGDLFMGIPAKVSDRAVTEGWAEDGTMYARETLKSRLWTLLYAIPTMALLITTFVSIRQKNTFIFYWTLFIGLSVFQIIPIVGLLSDKANNPPFIAPTLWILCSIFIFGQIFSMMKIIKITTKLKLC